MYVQCLRSWAAPQLPPHHSNMLSVHLVWGHSLTCFLSTIPPVLFDVSFRVLNYGWHTRVCLFLMSSTVEPVLGDPWCGRPLVLGDHNPRHRSFLTIKHLAWATTCQTRPATGSFGLTNDSFTCYERPDHAASGPFRQYCRMWSWQLNTKTILRRSQTEIPA